MQEQYEIMIEELDKVIIEKEAELINTQLIQTDSIAENTLKQTQISQMITYIAQLKQMREDYKQYLTNELLSGCCCNGKCCNKYFI